MPAGRRLLVDGFRLGPTAPPHRAVVDGDTKSAAIAAASIVAKVTRDRYMRTADAHLSRRTASRRTSATSRRRTRAVVRERGPCEIHRRSFRARATSAKNELAAALARPKSLGTPPSGAPRAGTACAATASSTRTAGSRGARARPRRAPRPHARLLRGEVEERRRLRRPARDGDADEGRAAMRRAAEAWLAAHPELRGLDVRFDVIADRAGRVEHLRDAF